jgi:hypothetical protein
LEFILSQVERLNLFNKKVKKDIASILNAVCKNTKNVKDTIYLSNKNNVKMRLILKKDFIEHKKILRSHYF